MNPVSLHLRRLCRWLPRLLCALALVGGMGAAHACSTGACVSAGPRLASVNSANGALLNLLLGNLTGSTLTLSVGDWTSLASGDVSLASTLSALQASVGASSPSTALSSNATLAQVIGAAATAATGEGKTSLALALNNLKAPLTLLSGTIRLGDLLVSDGALSNTRVNLLELVTGAIQLYNAKNVLTTPTAITVSGASLGLTGVATSVTLAAQVVEPPVFVCGAVGSTFHTATMRVQLGIDLVSLSLDSTLLKLIPGVTTATIQIGHLDLYAEIAHADGVINTINAIAGTFTVQATPGVASLYLGTINPTVFFNRSHTINAAADLTPGVIGSVVINSLNVSILAKASATGTPTSASTLNFTGPYPQGFTVSTGGVFVTSLLSSLAGNLQISLTAGLGLLSGAVTTVLGPIVALVLPVIVQPLVDLLINPLLETLGIGLGEVDVNGEGTILECTISGSVYADANHSAKLESGEAGTGVTLYAKLVVAATPTAPALAVATVDPTSGAYAFSGITPASYLIVINASAVASQVTAAAPSGWVGTETPTQSLAATLTTTDLASRNFGLYHGSVLGGVVFKDNGIGTGGIANNGLRDGTETALVGAAVKVTNPAGTTVYDSTTSGDLGTYSLWIPYTATGSLKVSHAPTAEWIAVSGNAGNTTGVFTQIDVSVTFTHVVGTVYSGVNFGDVPANRFEPDGQQQVLPGAVAFFAHSFTAGTGGQVGFAAAGTGASGWTQVIYADSNCNGKIDAGELPLAVAVGVVANQKVCLVVKVASPESAPYNAQYAVAITAHFVYANNTLTGDQVRNDQINAGNTSDSGLRLSKAVDKATAATGDTITYTISYSNQSDVALSALKILDATPAYTVFAAAACGTLPTGLTSCTVTTAPAIGAAGRVQWTFAGSLTSGAGGSVSFSVLVQ